MTNQDEANEWLMSISVAQCNFVAFLLALLQATYREILINFIKENKMHFSLIVSMKLCYNIQHNIKSKLALSIAYFSNLTEFLNSLQKFLGGKFQLFIKLYIT